MPAKKPPRGHRTPPTGLLPHHRAELEKSGLDAAAAAANGFHSESDSMVVARLLGWKGGAAKLCPCLVLPVFAADGSPTGFCQVKPDHPRERDGKPVKYESPKDKPTRVHLPPGTRAAVADPAVPLLVTEGFKKSAAADAHGFPCLGLVGVDCWSVRRPRGPNARPTGPRLLNPDLAGINWLGRSVVIAYDSDAATNQNVRRAEWRLAETLARAGAVVRVVRLPVGPDGGKQGLDDFLAARGADALRALVAAAGPATRPPHPGPTPVVTDGPAPPLTAADDKPSKPPAAADLLAAIGHTYDLWHDADRRAFATRGPHTHRVRSTDFRRRLLAEYRRQSGGKVPNAEAQTAAVNALDAAAVCDGPEGTAHIRLAGQGGRVYLHLADDAGTVVEVDANGWRVCPAPPVRFVKPAGMMPLPVPERGGDVAHLRRFVNAADDDAFALLVAFIDMAFNPAGPYPVGVLTGEQGSCKSSTAEAVKRLVDPREDARRGRPREERDLMITACRQRVVLFDNLRCLSDWLSDGLCRLSTGGAFATRTLYADDEETVFRAMRPVLLNGIADIAEAPDLLDRAVTFHHTKLPAGRRLTERKLWALYAAALPTLLGAFLDRAAGGLQAMSGVDLAALHAALGLGDDLPRMADFAEWAVACEIGAGGTGERFVLAYDRNRRTAHELALDVSPVSAAVVALMADRASWAGTPTELLTALTAFALNPTPRDWPKAANKLTGWLRVLKPDLLRARGLDVDPDGHDEQRNRRVTITAVRPVGRNIEPSGSSAPHPRPSGADDPDGSPPGPSGRAGGWRWRNDPREDAA